MTRLVARADDSRLAYVHAGRVGLLLTDLFAAHSPTVRERRSELMASAVSFGLGSRP